MESRKKIILIAIIIVFSICAVCIALLLNLQNKDKEENQDFNTILDNQTTEVWSELNDYETYFTIRSIVDKYVSYIQEINGDQYISTNKLNMTDEEIKNTLQEEALTSIKEILDKQYTNSIEVKDNDIISNLGQYKQQGNYKVEVNYNLNIETILTKDMENNITIALVNAKIVNKDLNLIIKLDKTNSTYSIFLQDFIEKYNYSKNMKKENINITTTKIEKNNYNEYTKVNARDSYIVSQIFLEYKEKMLNDTQEAYKLLDLEYSKKKYGNYENFKTYVEQNEEKIKYASISKYQVTENSGKKEYVCIDNNGKYYIFIEEAIAQFDVVLDTYTIDLPEFLQKYQNNSEEIKVGLNIQKVFDAINDEDYNYVYNKLDNTYKQNNFSNITSFENYARENLANKQLKYDNCKKER